MITNDRSARLRSRLVTWFLIPVIGAATALGITAPAQAALGLVPCEVTSTTPNGWPEVQNENGYFPPGFTKDFRVHNVGTHIMYGWNVTLKFPNGVTIDQTWSANRSMFGPYHMFIDAGYNGAVRPGRSVNFGLKATVADLTATLEDVYLHYAEPYSVSCFGVPVRRP